MESVSNKSGIKDIKINRYSAGSGKTRLISKVVDHLLDKRAESTLCSHSVAFFYCVRSTAEPKRADPTEIMSALVRQLSSPISESTINKHVVEEYKAREKRANETGSALKQLTVEDCTKLLLELTKDRPAIILIDALDEADENTRDKILVALDTLISSSEREVKVMISSREDGDIVSTIQLWCEFAGLLEKLAECWAKFRC